MSPFISIDPRSTGSRTEATRAPWGVHGGSKEQGATPQRTEGNSSSPGCVRARISRRAVWAVTFAVLALGLSACATGFERYNAGTMALLIGDRLMVQKECERRGVALYSNDTKILGCTDFAGRTVVSIPDPKVIAHEMCHWTLWTASHEACPLPVVQSP